VVYSSCASPDDICLFLLVVCYFFLMLCIHVLISADEGGIFFFRVLYIAAAAMFHSFPYLRRPKTKDNTNENQTA